jgi:superfamily II DNA/RNA helicase
MTFKTKPQRPLNPRSQPFKKKSFGFNPSNPPRFGGFKQESKPHETIASSPEDLIDYNLSFKDLELHESILKAVELAGYDKPTLIQQKAIPAVLTGRDLCASAQTGTGKTAAFILPSLNRLMTPSTKRASGPRVLILVPTRELAMQVSQEAIRYSKFLSRAKTVCIYGGAPYPIQNRQLSSPYEILVATPGRLMDHMERGRIDFGRLEILILDEADRMLDMGFIDPVEQIAAATPEDRQTLLFSATLRGNVLKLANKLLKDPVRIAVAPERARHDNIEQHLYLVNNLRDKQKTLDNLLGALTMDQAIVFTSTKRQADELTNDLVEKGHRAAALHGDMNQRQRTRTIRLMKDGEIKILVATDVAARGLDVQTVSHVINFDFPQSGDDYVHRIGRTGRAGAKGIALSFASPKDRNLLRQIEQHTGHRLIPQEVKGEVGAGVGTRAGAGMGVERERGREREWNRDRERVRPGRR